MFHWLKQLFSSSTPSNAQKSTAREHILVVDHSANIRAVLSELLKAQHYQVTCVQDHFKALEFLQNQTPHLILIAAQLPPHGGFELCTHLKKEDKWQNIPIIITSSDGEKDQQHAQRIGAEGFLIKPFSEHKLLDMLTSLLTKEGK